MSDTSHESGTATVLPPAGPGGPPRTGTDAPGGVPPRRGIPVWVLVLVIVIILVIAGVIVAFTLLFNVTSVSVTPSGPTSTATTAPTASVEPTVPAPTTAFTTTPKPPAEGLKTTTVRQLTLIKSVGGTPSGRTLVLDFLSDLSGTKAGEAWAKAHGDEWPPPNDYYYVNESSRLRTLKVSSKVTVTLTSQDGRKKLHPTMAGLISHLLSGGGDGATVSGSEYFWVTIVGGTTVTRIEQQWVP
jgi:hypothetical protein